MLLILGLLLFLRAGQCTDDGIIETKTVGVGDTVTLTCPRQTNDYRIYHLFWIRLRSGNMPEALGATYSFDGVAVNETPHFITKREPETFVLKIKEADLGDTGFYYCFKTKNTELTFLTATFLRIKGPDPDITLVSAVFPSDPVHPGASVTLQCSVLTDHKTCSGENNVFWFKDGLIESNPSFVYTQRHSGGECERSLEAHGSQTCYYNFSDFTSSDAGTYYCAVAACGKIVIGTGTKVDIEECTDDGIIETKTVGVGDTVTLTCPRQTNNYGTYHLFWIRLRSGNMPEVLGATYSFDRVEVNKTPHFITKQEPETFVLKIKEADLGDTGFYYCFKTKNTELTFLTGTFLRIKGPDPDITLVSAVFPSDPVHPGASVTLQCSVLTDHKTCSGENYVFWFKDGLIESNPSFVYTQRHSGGECERSLEAHGSQTCYYNFSDFTSSDAGTYYCAVAACGKIVIGTGTKVDIEANMWDLQKAHPLIILLCAALAVTLAFIAFLIYSLKKRCHDCDEASVTQKMNTTTSSGDQQSPQRDQDSVVYSAPKFTKRKTYTAAEGNETVYADVKAFQAN